MSDVGNSEPTVTGENPATGAGTETPPVQTSGEHEPVGATGVEPPEVHAVPPPVEPTAAPPPPESPEPEAPVELPLVHKHFTAPALLPLDLLEDDLTFLVREADELDDVSGLATDLARLGQLFPIDVRVHGPDQFQVVTGFRRVAALRFLQREKVLARLHTELSDADAMLMALASAIHSKNVEATSLAAVRERLEREGLLSAAARDMFEKALATESSLGPEQVEEEVDADELAGDVTVRLGECNQDLALLADVFDQLDDEKKDELLRQLRYSAELVTFLEAKR